tara:strand:+ start:608 stop:1057 length:450 start_codon:yes stop_codon:yes gene_type:complete
VLNILKNFFEEKDTDTNDFDSLELLCGLMIEAANSDGHIETEEVDKISSLLINVFKENGDDVKIKLQQAINNRNNSKSLFYYTSKINKIYSDEKKLLLIETLWEIVLSDGSLHDYESSLIRRLAGLMYISDVNSGNAKKRALNNISNKT